MKVNIAHFSAKQNRALAYGQALRTAGCLVGQIRLLKNRVADNALGAKDLETWMNKAMFYIDAINTELRALSGGTAKANKFEKEEAKAAKRIAKQLEA